MAEYRYYLIPDFMSHVFPQQFEEQAPTEFFSNTADLLKAERTRGRRSCPQHSPGQRGRKITSGHAGPKQ